MDLRHHRLLASLRSRAVIASYISKIWRQRSSRPATGLDPMSEEVAIYKVCNQAQVFSNELLSFLEVDMETCGSGETVELPIWILLGCHHIFAISLYSRV